MASFYLLSMVMVSLYVSLFFSPLSLAIPLSPPKPLPFNKVYVFGDSYTDTGNTNSSTAPFVFQHISALPYGSTFFNRPTNRYSDGRLVVDFIAESLNLPYIPPYLNKSSNTTRGANFAIGGCTAIPYPFFLKNNATTDTVPHSLPSQLTWFKNHIKPSGCKDAVSTPAYCNSVFDDALVWIGQISANDYNYVYGTNVTSKTVQKLSIFYEIKFIKELLKMGAKYVVVQGLPTTGCFPLSLAALAPPTDRDEMGCVASKNKESYEHNVVLQHKLQRLREEFPSTVIVYSDDWHAYREVYGNPTKYGFVDRFKACCGVKGVPYDFNMMSTCGATGTSSCEHPSTYMNWDGLHVTEGLNRVVSRLFLDGAFAQPPFPYLLKKATESRLY